MSKSRVVCLATVIAGLLSVFERPAAALPTMVRLGYPNCASCHVSPQGGGLLNLYGRGIDQAQSLLGGAEYQPSENRWIRDLNWGGRVTQDIRTVIQQQEVSTTDKPGTQLFRSRFLYRNATELGNGFRFTATLTGENTSAPRPSLSYDLAVKSAELFVNTALLSYRARNTLEIAVGRDQLPTGINIPDLAVFIRSRNRLGYYDAPTQVKAFIWGKRYLVTPYAFGPGGNERSGQHESGGGTLAEFDLLGKGRTIAGMNLLRGTAAAGDRTLIGPYARLGFGKWGILAEHDITDRTLKTGSLASFRQSASYGQLFWAAREWLVPSLVVERLRVDRPYQERLNAIKLDLSARLSRQLTISAGPRIQRDELSGRTSRSIVFQLAMKTVH
ncbi:MAG: hypothetical protein M3Z36_08775 [Acidobacteriota bacterium]|nr:hypothetical protein [Acidobacteriota bacterium]